MSSDIKELYSKNAGNGPPLFFPQPEVPIVFNFDQGLAAPETFPRDQLQSLADEVLQRDGSEALEYFDADVGYEELVFGHRGLRQQLSARIQRRDGRDLGEKGLILTSGSVQALALAISGYLNPGDVVVVEAASFPYAMRYMEMAGAEIRTVPVDNDGMDVGALADLAEQITSEGKTLKMVYTIATFQLPTGAVMSLPRRRHLIELSKKHQFIVIEDNVYGELRFDGDPLPTLLSLDDGGLVIQADAFSKTVAPGLRLGWMAGSEPAIAALAAVRQDLGVSQWLSRLMAEFLSRDLFEEHLAQANAVYKARCNAAVEAIEKHCADYVSFTRPQGSFYLWLKLDSRVDWDRAAVMAAEHGVFCRPGEKFMGPDNDENYLRLAYSHVDETVIREGIATLGSILAQCANEAA